MPNPARMHHQSSKLEHFLGIADLFIRMGQPQVFDVEPHITDNYRPDVYMVKDDRHAIVEYQRTIISHKKMQNKVDAFVAAYNSGRHNCRTLLIVTDYRYNVTAPSSFKIVQLAKTEKAPSA